MNMIFDTLEISEKLKSAKFTKAQTDTLIDIYRHQNEQVVTKDDLIAARGAMKDDLIAAKSDLEAKIEGTESRLEAKIESTEFRLEAKIESTESRLEAKMYRAMTVQTFAIVGILFTLLKFFQA